METRICKLPGCENQLQTRDKRQQYCSRDCVYKAKMKPKHPRKCQRPGCEVLIPPEKDKRQKYCTHTCAALKNNEPRKKHKYCFYCNKELPHNAHGDYPKFCSTDCRNDYNFEIRVNGGFQTGAFRARSYYIRKRGYGCEICKNVEWLGKSIPIELHHKNGDHSDNRPENVILQCRNCHAFTDTFGVKNIGNGQKLNPRNRKIYHQ